MDRERNALTDEEKEEVVRAERAGRRRQDKGSTVLSLLEQSLSELVKSNAQSDLADGLRRATEADVAAVPVVEDGMVTLTQQHLEVVQLLGRRMRQRFPQPLLCQPPPSHRPAVRRQQLPLRPKHAPFLCIPPKPSIRHAPPAIARASAPDDCSRAEEGA